MSFVAAELGVFSAVVTAGRCCVGCFFSVFCCFNYFYYYKAQVLPGTRLWRGVGKRFGVVDFFCTCVYFECFSVYSNWVLARFKER